MTTGSEELDWLVESLGVHTPTEEQTRVITHPLTVRVGGAGVASPLLVVAGAGSGKTETMSLRAVYLSHAAGIPDEAILGLTFTRKAAAELGSRLTDRLAQLRQAQGSAKNRGLLEFESSPVATTYNAFALDVVREFGPMIGLRGDLEHMGAAASWQLMIEVVEGWTTPLRGDSALSTVAERAMSLREAIANQGISLNEARARLELVSRRFTDFQADCGGKLFADAKVALEANLQRLELLDIIEEFEARKRELGRVDFADQVMLAHRIVTEVTAARDELRARHRVVFLDEFQDTSVAQMRFLAALFKDHPVTAVGDPNQAIYGWRGASAASLEDFHDSFSVGQSAPRTTVNLSTAWRNARSILDVANRIGEPLRGRPSWIADARGGDLPFGPRLLPREGAPLGDVSIRYRHSADEQIAEIVGFVDETRRRAIADGGPAPTIAVLCRTRRLITPILEALISAGFAAETGGADGLLHHPAVLDLRAALEIASDIGRSSQLLRLLVNLDLGSRDLWLLHLWAAALARKGADDGAGHPTVLLLEAVDRALDLTVPAAVEESGISQVGIRRIRGMADHLRSIRRATDRTVLEQIEHARRVLGLEQQAMAVGRAMDITEVLDTFTQTAADYQDSALAPTLSGFLSWLDAAESQERGLSLPAVAPNPEAVQVMTIHGAKGLEWDAVAVADMESGTFPSFSSQGPLLAPPTAPVPQLGWWKASGELPYIARDDSRHLPGPPVLDSTLKVKEIMGLFREDVGAYLEAEERRLAYVAVTRPRQRLLLTGSWTVTGASPKCPSIFLAEAAGIVGQTTGDVSIEECPTDQELSQLSVNGSAVSFPREPGQRRKQMAIAAKAVAQEIEALETADDWELDLSRALASIDDPGLVQRAQFLAAEYFEQQRKRAADPNARAEQDVRAAASGQTWEFAATQLFDAVDSDEIWLDLRRPVPREVGSTSGVGTAFHEWVETTLRRVPAAETVTETVVPGALQGDAVSQGPAGLGFSPAERAHFRKLQASFRDIPWVGDMEVEGIEIPFAFEIEGLLVRGRIDAVFKDPARNEYWLIDWKTGRVPEPGASDQRIGRYLSQLAIYREAWSRRIGDPDARLIAKLVFVSETGHTAITQESLNEQYRAATGIEWTLSQAVSDLGRRLATES